MAANNKWLLPTQVNAGDTIAITLANGAGHDGGVSPWQCPNGQQFFLGSCVGLTGTDGSDPAPSIAHMRLIAEIDGTFYDAYNGSITVPGGVVSADVVFQINDADLSDNSGSYTFDVCVTNNAETTFDHLFDFSTGDGGWSTTVYAPANPNLLAHYDAGNCWETVEYYVIAAPNNRGVNCNIFRDIPARTITDIEITYERDTVGNDSFGNTPLMQIIYNVTGVQLNTNIANSGVESYHVSTPGVTHLGVSFQAGGRTDGTPCTSHGKITQIRVKGIGSDPF